VTAPVFVVDPEALATATAGDVVRLDGPEGRHAATVRRLRVGEPLHLVDGNGRRARGVVGAIVGRDGVDVVLDDVADEPTPEPRIVVVQALPKGERGELAVELLTEIGADVIVPWSAAACVAVWKGERATRGRGKWHDTAVAAAKQARRARFPVVAPLATTADVVERIRSATAALVLDEQADRPLASVPLPEDGDLVIVVGPEGGLTAPERAEFEAVGAMGVRLGPTVLRTSSAGLAAVAALLARSPRWAVAADERMAP
jgi:16S rRNA (uracil1498-N3)-methyltransferase